MADCLILPGYWQNRIDVNARSAIFHQWEQLERSGCIDNFRIAAGEKEGFREGWFFADSDAYKWLDAAARIYATHPDPRLARMMDEFIALIGRAQSPDGYLYTYNQIHFPGVRWVNLQIDHELYCHGHLIEAGVSHYQATGQTSLLEIARRAADRIVADFRDAGPEATDGHEEIEIALLRLFEVTGHRPYLEMARRFLERRGHIPRFALHVLRQYIDVMRRERLVRRRRREYLQAHPEHAAFRLPLGNPAKPPWSAPLRWYVGALSGTYFQQHAPLHRQTVPVGHAARFGYLMTAAAMLARLDGDRALLPVLEQAWEHMVSRRMYVTGGLGSLPLLEGFGRDYELDPEYAYAETCAAIASVLWNREMAQLTDDARYSDLLEWQLYNAASVGMGLDGTTYFYNNPLASRGGIERRTWFAVPCCPSNLSRTFASLHRFIYACLPEELQVHQYISARWSGEWGDVEMESDLPWEGRVRLRFIPPRPTEFILSLRLPSWADPIEVKVNGSARMIPPAPPPHPKASGYDPRGSRWLSLRRTWARGDTVEITLGMPIVLRRAHPRVRGHRGKVAVTRGPLVYCLESVDNPGVDIFRAALIPESLEAVSDADLLGGVVKIVGRGRRGEAITLIPYHLWGNQGPSQMTVWVGETKSPGSEVRT